jgi:dihydroflavonol-4-reductase
MTAAHFTRIAKMMSNVMPGGQQGVYVRHHLANPVLLSSEKIKRDLKMSFLDPATALRDTIENLVKWGHVPSPAIPSSPASSD